MQPKLYVLVRDDLKSAAYKAVQAGHVVAEFMIDHPGKWDNDYLIYLKVKNEEELRDWYKNKLCRSIPFTFFTEPDLGNQMTAIAVLDDGRLFKDLKLL